jgi:alkylated DNA repair dioxygenase AlkB
MTDADYYWFRPPREGRASTFYATRHASGRICEQGEQAVIDIEDRELQTKIAAFNALVHKHRVCPAQTLPNDPRREKLALLREEAARTLQIYDINDFVKRTVWPYCLNGGDLRHVGFYVVDDFIPPNVSHTAIEDAVFPSCYDETRGSVPNCYAWEDNDKKHEQNREVCTHGVTLLDREQLIPAEVAPLPLPELVRRELVPGLEAFLEHLELPSSLDFLYANRYRRGKRSYIRFHHDQLTKMGPVVVGVSLGATAHLTLVRTCSSDTKLPGRDGSVDVQLRAGSMYVMSGIARYGLKHGVLDASARGDRVSLTFREVTKKRPWVRPPADVVGPLVRHPAALGCACCRRSLQCVRPRARRESFDATRREHAPEIRPPARIDTSARNRRRAEKRKRKRRAP